MSAQERNHRRDFLVRGQRDNLARGSRRQEQSSLSQVITAYGAYIQNPERRERLARVTEFLTQIEGIQQETLDTAKEHLLDIAEQTPDLYDLQTIRMTREALDEISQWASVANAGNGIQTKVTATSSSGGRHFRPPRITRRRAIASVAGVVITAIAGNEWMSSRRAETERQANMAVQDVRLRTAPILEHDQPIATRQDYQISAAPPAPFDKEYKDVYGTKLNVREEDFSYTVLNRVLRVGDYLWSNTSVEDPRHMGIKFLVIKGKFGDDIVIADMATKDGMVARRVKMERGLRVSVDKIEDTFFNRDGTVYHDKPEGVPESALLMVRQPNGAVSYFQIVNTRRPIHKYLIHAVELRLRPATLIPRDYVPPRNP